MKNPELEDLEIRLNEIEEQLEEIDVNDLEEKVYQLEDEINLQKQSCSEDEFEVFEKLSKRIDQIKKENDFYDEESVLDYMFPDRHDSDFDEDSMSYDSVFGED